MCKLFKVFEALGIHPLISPFRTPEESVYISYLTSSNYWAKKPFDKKYWFSISLSIVLFIAGIFVGASYYYGDYTEIKQQLEICNSSAIESIIASPGAYWSKDDKSTTVITEGPMTVQGSLSIGAGGSLQIGWGSSTPISYPVYIKHDYNLAYSNVLVKMPSGDEAFVDFYLPFTWLYIGLCNEDYSDCMVFNKFLNLENKTACNLLDFSSGKIVPRSYRLNARPRARV